MQTRHGSRKTLAALWSLFAGFLLAIPLAGIAGAQDEEQWYDPTDWFDDDSGYYDEGYYDEGYYDSGYDDDYYGYDYDYDYGTDWGGDTAWEDEFEETYGYEYWTDDDGWYDDPWYM